MGDRDMYIETICAVVDSFGGYQALAARLNVQADDLLHWAQGKTRPPTDVFLRLVDLARDKDIDIHV